MQPMQHSLKPVSNFVFLIFYQLSFLRSWRTCVSIQSNCLLCTFHLCHLTWKEVNKKRTRQLWKRHSAKQCSQKALKFNFRTVRHFTIASIEVDTNRVDISLTLYYLDRTQMEWCTQSGRLKCNGTVWDFFESQLPLSDNPIMTTTSCFFCLLFEYVYCVSVYVSKNGQA